jgi:hypothetical protein
LTTFIVLSILASMALLDEHPPAHVTDTRATGPDQGVIEEARRRQRTRRRRGLAAAATLLIIGGIAAAVIGASHSRPNSKGGGAAGPSAAIRAKRARELSGIRLSPALEGGAYGWCLAVYGGSSCPTLPTATSPMSGVVGVEPSSHEEVITALLAPGVAGVLVNGLRVPATTLPAQLPYHLRVARITIPTTAKPALRRQTAPGPGNTTAGGATTSASPGGTTAPRPPVGGTASPGQPGPTTPALLAIDAHGNVLPQTPVPTNQAIAGNILWWEQPHTPPRSPCQIHAQGIPGLSPQWGHLAVQIKPYPGKIVGRAFFSCIDTEYYLQNWPMDAAILLDAAHPGSTPAAIPNLKPMPQAPRFFNGPSARGELTATRTGNAWLVVEGGSGPTQRLLLLRHLTATVKL